MCHIYIYKKLMRYNIYIYTVLGIIDHSYGSYFSGRPTVRQGGEHTDFGSVTVLLVEDGVPGLEASQLHQTPRRWGYEY